MFYRITKPRTSQAYRPSAKAAKAKAVSRGIVYTKVQADPKLRKLMQNHHLYSPRDSKEYIQLNKIIKQTKKTIAALDSKSFHKYLQDNASMHEDKIPK